MGKLKSNIVLCLGVFIGFHASAQSDVSFQKLEAALPYLLQASVQGNPSLRAAWLDVAASGLDISVAERARWPVLSAVVESKSGNLSSVPNRLLRAEQTLWDGGLVSRRIDEATVQKKIALYRYGVQQQQVFLSVITGWQAMVTASQKKKAAQQALERLQNYREQMMRRVQAQASPQIDLELVQARYSQTEVELSSITTTYLNALSRLEQITGLSRSSGEVQDLVHYTPLLIEPWVVQIRQEDIEALASSHVQVAKARADSELVQSRLHVKDAERWPQIYARVDQPVGKATTNTDTSVVAFLGLRYVSNPGFSNSLEQQALATRVGSSEESVQASRREVKEQFENDREDILSTQIKVKALESSVAGSAKVLESYQRQFQGGRKSWLDLLNAVRELAQNEYALAEAQANLMAAIYRFQVRAGKPIS